MDNKDKPAFSAANAGKFQNGLTKREYFAGLAMQGMSAYHGDDQRFKTTAKESVEMADALLKALESEV